MFYGWKVVWALFVMLTFSSGLGFYNHSVIIQALSQQGGFDITLASAAVSVFFLVSGFSGLVLAPLLDRYDVRWVILPGVAVSAIALGLLGQVETLTGLFVLYAFFGIGFAAGGLLPATTLVARWFETNRARALSVASTGLSVGGVLLTPLSAYLVEQFPLDVTFFWLAVAYLIGVLPICAIVLRSHPSDIGLHPDGSVSPSSQASSGMDYSAALKQHFFWGLAVSYLLTMCAQVGGIAHQYGVLIERLTPAEASIGVGVMPAFSVIGRLAGGMILDRISTLRFTLVMMVIQGLALLAISIADHVVVLYLSLAVFGLSVGNLLMLQPLIVAEVYGLKHYARIYSRSNLVGVMGVSSGPVLMGWLFGYSETYSLAYMVVGGLGILSAIVFSVLRPPRWSDAIEGK